jgi:putative membrane protein
MTAFENLLPFFQHWGITAISLWAASRIFRGLKFDNVPSLVIAALLLGLANAVVRPLLIALTFPLTLLTFGLFLLVINALMILLVARLVKGFKVSSFWTALFASIFVSVLSFLVGAVLSQGDPQTEIRMPHDGTWL